MTLPLLVLGVLSAIAASSELPLVQGGQRLDLFLEPVFADAAALVPAAYAAHAEGAEIGLMLISLAVALVGSFVAYRFYVADPAIPRRLAEQTRGIYKALFNKYWVDEAYDALIVQPLYRWSVKLWEDFDDAVIDGAVNGVGRMIQGDPTSAAAQVGYGAGLRVDPHPGGGGRDRLLALR